ncbi:MAG: cation:proton antiporter [Polyangiaceae bacterium]
MHDAHELLRTLTIVLGTAAVTTVVFQRLKQPVILGYLVAGMLVGPHFPFPLAADMDATRTLSELGVILLMFSLGLEFSIRSLVRVGPKAGLIAVVQCSLMVWLGHLVGDLFGWTSREGLYAGGIIAISSTTIIVKAFSELGVRGKFKETVFGVLIVEDLIAILLLTIFTALSSGTQVTAGALALTAGRLAAFLAALLFVGMLAVPRLLRFTLRLNRPETTVVAAIALCFFCAWLAQSFGYSVALGAFVAGSLIAESGEGKTIEHAIVPVRDLFGAIFFVSVGMLIEPRLIAANWGAAVVLTIAVVLGKILFVAFGSLLTGAGVRPSVQAGMSLAQIGEFSFIIAGLGLSLGATRDFLYPLAVAVSAVTTLFTPWLVRGADPVAAWVDRKLPAPVQTFLSLYGSWIERARAPVRDEVRRNRRRMVRVLVTDVIVIVLLAGVTPIAARRFGADVADRAHVSADVAALGIAAAGAVLVAPFVLGAIRTTRHLGHLFADDSFPEAQEGKLDLAAASRRAFVVALQLVIVVLIGTPLLALTEPFVSPWAAGATLAAILLVLAVRFWRTATDLQSHVRAAATVILEALAKQAHAPSSERSAAPRPIEELTALLPGLSPVAVRLREGSHAVGRSLADLDLRGLTGASVLAVSHEGGEGAVPSPKAILRAGDTLALAGAEDSVAAAAALLLDGPGDRITPP